MNSIKNALRAWLNSAITLSSSLLVSVVLASCSSDSDSKQNATESSQSNSLERPPTESTTLPDSLRAPTDNPTLPASLRANN